MLDRIVYTAAGSAIAGNAYVNDGVLRRAAARAETVTRVTRALRER
jgi:hypothetical protein